MPANRPDSEAKHFQIRADRLDGVDDRLLWLRFGGRLDYGIAAPDRRLCCGQWFDCTGYHFAQPLQQHALSPHLIGGTALMLFLQAYQPTPVALAVGVQKSPLSFEHRRMFG